MIKTLIPALFLIASTFSSIANASFIVEQYDDFWSSSLANLQTYANNNAASTIASFEYLDFSDTNSNLDFSGFNLWPSDAPVYSGANAAINSTFFVKATGLFDIAADGNYNIRTYNDDGVFVFIDNVLQISDPTLHPPVHFYTGHDFLSAGTHSIELYFFENAGGANLEVGISGNNNSSYSLLNSAAVPEPSIIALFAAGLVGLGVVRRRRTQK